jgi:hypothetical protein
MLVYKPSLMRVAVVVPLTWVWADLPCLSMYRVHAVQLDRGVLTGICHRKHHKDIHGNGLLPGVTTSTLASPLVFSSNHSGAQVLPFS